jgi:hypothetical protein
MNKLGVSKQSPATQGTAAPAAAQGGAAAAPPNGKVLLERYLPLSSLAREDKFLLVKAMYEGLTGPERARVEQLVQVKTAPAAVAVDTASAPAAAVLVGTKRPDSPAAVLVGIKRLDTPAAVLVGTKRPDTPAAAAAAAAGGGRQQQQLLKGKTSETGGQVAVTGGQSTSAPAAAVGSAAKTGIAAVQRTVPPAPQTATAVQSAASVARDLKALVPRPPCFDGKGTGMRIKPWLDAMTAWLNLSPAVPDAAAVDTAASYLRGEALELWLAETRTLKQLGKDPTDWGVFSDALMLWYATDDFVTRRKILDLVQKGSLQAYIRELVLLFGDLDGPANQVDMVCAFFRGLKPELAQQGLSQLNPANKLLWTTFQGAAQHVLLNDGVMQAFPNTDDGTSSGTGGCRGRAGKRKAARLS